MRRERHANTVRNPNSQAQLKKQLWAAIELDDSRSVQQALENGAPVNSLDIERRTPIIYTLLRRNRKWARIAGLLIHHGADMRGEYGKSKSKLTALDLLIRVKDDEELEVVEQYTCGIFAA